MKIYDGHVQVFAFCLLSAPADLTCVAPHFEHMKRNIQLAGERNSARSPHVSFLETRNAQGGRIGAFFVSLFVFYVSFFLCSDFDPFDGRDPTLLVYTEPDTY